MTTRARQYVAFGVLVAAALASGAAKADGPMSPSNCAAVGATVGGLLGSQYGNTNVKNAVGAALGALGGATVGHWLCSPKSAPSRDSSYQTAANFGVGDGGTQVDRSEPKAPLSFSERERLDDLSKQAIDAKYAWKRTLWDVDQARQSGFAARTQNALEHEASARRDFENKRATFATTVAKLNNGVEGAAPRAVGRYIEISAALLELSTDTRTSYQALRARDEAIQQESPAYKEEANRVARIRNSGGRA